MDVLILTAFISLMLVVTGLLFFVWNIRQGSHEHDDRLVLLPLQDDPSSRTEVETERED